MKPLKEIWNFIWRASDVGSSGYEASKSNNNRSTLDQPIQNARQDLSKVTRREILRKARYLYKNSPMVRGLIERLVTFTVGTGLTPIPMSSDPVWNEKALKAFKGWSKNADIESRLPFEALQAVIFRAMLVDGDIFSLNTYGPSGRPRMQLIESHDIVSKSTHNGNPDGIELDAYARPLNYIWREDSLVPASDMVHYWLPERAGQKRGVSILASVINVSHDVDDILALEKASVKDGSSKTDIIKTADGELPTDDYIGESMQDADAANSIPEITNYYRTIFSPEAKVMRKGDEFDPYVSGRPSPAWMGFMDFLTDLICMGPGLPPSLLKGNKVGGADTRRDVATAQRVIENWQRNLATGLQQVWEYVILEDIKSGALRGAPADWRETEWQTPAKLTVDAGREADSDREDVKLGLLTRREYFSRWGMDWKAETRQQAVEAAEISSLAKEFKVERGEICLLDPNELSANAQKEKPTETPPTEPKPQPDKSKRKFIKPSKR
jgi:capsid protein